MEDMEKKTTINSYLNAKLEFEKSLYLGIDGVPKEKLPIKDLEFLTYNSNGFWSLQKLDVFVSLESQYEALHRSVVKKLWGSRKDYENVKGSIASDWRNILSSAGLNSKSAISKDAFVKLLDGIEGIEYKKIVNKYLYTIDVFCLITNIQEITNEIVYISGEFYYILNFDTYCQNISYSNEQVVIDSQSPLANKLIGLMTLIYVRLHSLLDYHTKLAYEIERIKVGFEKYPKLSSKDKIYSHKNKLKIGNSKGTLFEKDAFINEIESYRNELIHNSLLDDTPRIHKNYKNSNLVECYVLLPSTNEQGRLESYINRKFFYPQKVKFNLILPSLLRTFQERQLKTLELLSQTVYD